MASTSTTRTPRSSTASAGDGVPSRAPSDPAATDNTVLNRSGDFSTSTTSTAPREARIAEAAYYRAERRGFDAGNELEDWLEAEREIDSKETGASLATGTAH